MSWTDPDTSAEGVATALSNRRPLVEALADGPRSKADLEARLGVARSTVYKGLRELETVGVVRVTDEGYALTQFGRLARRKHDDYRATVERLCAVRSVLSAVPADVHLPLSFIERSQVVMPERHAPERPLTTFEAVADEADRLWTLSPVAIPRFMPDIHEDVECGDRDIEIVVEPAALDALMAGYDAFDAAVEAGLRVYESPGSLPFGLTLFDDEAVSLAAYASDGSLRGLLLCTCPDAMDWAEGVYERHRAAAAEV
ncbi:helix-turn-helix transcriptional regulator [Halorarius litoreus]|uniref:helix-turn-helix transcriptional regulator n=1 Tax=Halorarius litoreus TaxID=2962676 RepID=UPI0020CF98D4|nr:helix-turn-helix domain-containing protein [Halorarius litoreus]